MKISRMLVAIVLIGCSCFLVLSTSSKPQTASSLPVQKSRTTPEEATLIQEGVMTQRQRKHSELFKGTDYQRGKKISELVAEKGDVELRGPIEEVVRLPQVSPGEALARITCGSDAIVIGTVTAKSSNIIKSGTFLFTDYEIAVTEVLKNNPASAVNVGDTITVPRLGGAVSLGGHVVRATDETMAGLTTGKSYLLYLKFLPDSGTYRPLGHPAFDDTFQLQGEYVTQVSRKQLPVEWKLPTPAGGFMREVRTALSTDCASGGLHD
jgi:hypothetical protein